jgi:hypothetical protein
MLTVGTDTALLRRAAEELVSTLASSREVLGEPRVTPAPQTGGDNE